MEGSKSESIEIFNICAPGAQMNESSDCQSRNVIMIIYFLRQEITYPMLMTRKMMECIICLTSVPSGGLDIFLSLDKYRNENVLKVRIEVKELINRPTIRVFLIFYDD